MCHQAIQPSPPDESQASGDALAAPAQRGTEPDPPEEVGDQNQHCDVSQETQNESVGQDPMVQPEEMESFEQGGGEKQDPPAEPQGQGLCFSSTGDFVGFASPTSSCSSGDFNCSQVLLGNPSLSDMPTQSEERSKEPQLPSSPDAVNEKMFEGHSDNFEVKLKTAVYPGVPQNDMGEHKGCVSTPDSGNSFDSPKLTNKSNDMSGLGSCNENSEPLKHSVDSQSCNENGVYLHSDLEPPPAETDCPH